MTITDLENLLALVLADGPGADVQLIAADAAEDADRPFLAECLRWMHAGKKWPDHGEHLPDGATWRWYESSDHPESSRLPQCEGEFVKFWRSWKWHDSVATAIRTLWSDWETARRSGWQPENLSQP
jgi:hypothetical protein